MKFKIYFILHTGLTSTDSINPHGYIVHKQALLSLNVMSNFCP